MLKQLRNHLLEIKQDVKASSGVVSDQFKKKKRNTGPTVEIPVTSCELDKINLTLVVWGLGYSGIVCRTNSKV